MGLFYDPAKRKTQPWVMVAFVIIPIVLVSLLITTSQEKVRKHKIEAEQKQTFDIFNALDSEAKKQP